MPAPIQAIGLDVQPVDPLKGINTMSGILGLKQQQQTLQTGQYQQQTASAEADQAQQKNSELQKAQSIALQGAKSGQYTKADGTLDRQKMADDITTVAPTYGQGVASSLLSQANEVVANTKAHQELSRSQQQQLSSTFGGLATKPDLSNTDVIDALDNLTDQNPGIKRMALSMSTHLPANATPDQLRNIVRQWSIAGTSPESAAGQSAPNVSLIQGKGQVGQPDAGQSGLVPTNVNPQAPGGIRQVGPVQQQSLAPTEEPAYKQVAAAATATGGARASGVASSDIDRANQVSANVKPAQAGIQTTQQIDDLADQIHSGKFAGWLSKQAASAGVQESTFARQLLEKDLGIVKTQLTSAAPSDSRAATILSGTPEATSDPQTIHGAMDYVRGSLRQNLAQGQNLSAYKAKHPDLSGFQGADDNFTGTAGPLVHEFLSLKDKDAQAAFYRRNFSSPQEALQFRNKAFGSAHTLGLDDADR
jgi:hypothetical protein